MVEVWGGLLTTTGGKQSGCGLGGAVGGGWSMVVVVRLLWLLVMHKLCSRWFSAFSMEVVGNIIWIINIRKRSWATAECRGGTNRSCQELQTTANRLAYSCATIKQFPLLTLTQFKSSYFRYNLLFAVTKIMWLSTINWYQNWPLVGQQYQLLLPLLLLQIIKKCNRV